MDLKPGKLLWPQFALLLILGLSLCSCKALQLNDDVLGLIVFKADLVDPMNALRSWTEDDFNPCNWTGIGCNPQTGRVIIIQLHGLSLSGHIGRGLAKLQYLQTLSLAYNNFSGTIDSEVAQLKSLRKVDVSHNQLSGPFNAAFGNLGSLKSLDFSSNVLSGSIPSELFSNCRSLHYLSLAKNSLEGSIPDSIGSCLGLRTLNISANSLNGVLPVSMAALTGLSVLDVSYNLFTGVIPEFVTNLASLVDVRLQRNSFTGFIPEHIGNCFLLEYVDLSSNFLSGGLPDSMQRLESLATLNLARNSLSGIIPSWIGKLRSLTGLDLSYNVFSGPIPQTVALLKSLQSVNLSHNRFTGQITGGFSSCPLLEMLDLSSNNFTGSIPEGLLGHGLLVMSLENNQLTGQLAASFFHQCDSLQTLDLSKNELHGVVPPVGTCSSLKAFNLSSNSFSGYIPSFPKSSSLLSVDMSHNQLNGSIPTSIGELGELSVLVLNRNNLAGTIPSQLGSCSALTNINLSNNDLLGSIPPELGNLSSLQALDLSYNNISGTIPPQLDQLQRLTMLNLSYNQLEGPIPDGGIFRKVNKSAFLGNDGLCGINVNPACPSVMPKPIVLNPNSSITNPGDQNPLLGAGNNRHIVLSPSAILAISAAAVISLGVVVVLILNAYAQSLPRSTPIILDSLSQSVSSDLPIGKLVMFTKNPDPRSEEWVTSAHALLNKDSELGRGGFGTVYKAVLADGRTVAIKKLMVSSLVKSQEEFEKEVQLLGRIKHRNLLGLQGYYWTPQLQLLIYDFIPNGNLYSRLHEKSHATAPLSWPARFKIALGTARGLAHLHHMCNPQVIHYNMKSSNVLLDESMNPKISDFGLANLLPMLDKYLMSSKFQSALGYMAPEFACRSLRINEKCDVYGYGVMLLELVTGRRPVEYMEDDVVILCDYVRSLLDEGRAMTCVDGDMQDYVEDEVLPVIKLGLICTSQVPSNRPSMAEVVQILELIKTPGNSRDLL